MKKKLKILLILDHPHVTPRGYDFKEEFEQEDYQVYKEVTAAIKNNGHTVSLLGIHNDLTLLLEEIKENRPDLAFNLTDIFDDKSHFDKNMAWFLEMLGLAYTGASPASLLICNNKSLTKTILSYHRIKVPNFHTFYRNHKVWHPKRLKFPLVVKPLREEASRGIAQASVVDNETAMFERIKFIHENMKMDVIAEEYIDGREFYVSLLGHTRIKVLPIREMKFGEFSEDEPRIATYKAKWDYQYRKKWGLKNTFAGRLPEGWEKKISDTCKRAYRVMDMAGGYARFDLRVTAQGQVYIIEANANPNLQKDDEFALSADKAGISFDVLIEKVVDLGMARDT